jgi:hypothetical protein
MPSQVEMVGRLVEQQQVGLERERERERGALALAARRRRGGDRLVEPKRCRNSTSAPRCASARARRPIARAAAQREALAQRARPPAAPAPAPPARCAPSRRRTSPVVELERPAMACSSDDLPVPLRPMRPMRSSSCTDERAPSSKRVQAERELGVLSAASHDEDSAALTAALARVRTGTASARAPAAAHARPPPARGRRRARRADGCGASSGTRFRHSPAGAADRLRILRRLAIVWSRVTVLKLSKRSLRPIVRPDVALAPQVVAHAFAQLGEDARQRLAIALRREVALERCLAADRLGLAERDHGPLVAAVRRVVQPCAVVRAEVLDEPGRIGCGELPDRLDPERCEARGGLRPMPLILRGGSGQIRVARSSGRRIVRPSGLSSSEAILASSLLGATAIEHDNPVAARTAPLSARAMPRARSHGSADA